MKALSLRDYGRDGRNFATYVYLGVKKIETRKWGTAYRGDILICCSAGSKSQHAGLALCIVEVVHIRMMAKVDEHDACCELYPKARSWILKNHRSLSRHFPVKGTLGLYDVEIPKDVKIKPTGLF